MFMEIIIECKFYSNTLHSSRNRISSIHLIVTITDWIEILVIFIIHIVKYYHLLVNITSKQCSSTYFPLYFCLYNNIYYIDLKDKLSSII